MRHLPAIAARAKADPLQLELWGSAAGSSAARKALARLEVAASRGCLRGFVEAAGTSEGEVEVWLSCLHGMVHALARGGGVHARGTSWICLIFASLTNCFASAASSRVRELTSPHMTKIAFACSSGSDWRSAAAAWSRSWAEVGILSPAGR